MKRIKTTIDYLKKQFVNKQGFLKANYDYSLLGVLDSKDGTFAGLKRWSRNGRHCVLSDSKYYRVIELLDVMQVEYKQGNSAKGGAESDYIQVTAKGMKRLKKIAKEVNVERTKEGKYILIENTYI